MYIKKAFYFFLNMINKCINAKFKKMSIFLIFVTIHSYISERYGLSGNRKLMGERWKGREGDEEKRGKRKGMQGRESEDG